MLAKPKQFELPAQISAALDELEAANAMAAAAHERVRRLAERLTAELEKLQEMADSFEVFTEAEAAALFKLESTAKNPERAELQMRELRRRYDLPHVSIGRETRYTRQHLIEICAILGTGKSGKFSASRAA